MEKEFIIEKASDLTTNKIETPFSYNIQNMWCNYSTKNIILHNGQMICLKCDDKILLNISDIFSKILIEFITSEKALNECDKIKIDYMAKKSNINNTSIYVKKILDIIINMDRVYKFIWNIAKLLVDNIDSYNNYIAWQKSKIKYENTTIYEDWQLIYGIRNKIEHPNNLHTTYFSKNHNCIKTPKIFFNDIEYDLFELGKLSITIAYRFLIDIIDASFLYSKYLVCFTNKDRTELYAIDNKV